LIGYFQEVHDRYRVRRRRAHTISTRTPPPRVQLHTRPVSLRTLFHKKPVPGGWWSRLGFGVRLARSRARWLFAWVMGKAYVARVLRQCQRSGSLDVGSPERNTRSG
jgi:hypothetical protein